MYGLGSAGILVVLIIGIIVVLLPVKLAAVMMDAERDGFGWCLLALIVATILQTLASYIAAGFIGNIVALAFSAVGFSLILGTGFFGGVGIAILHVVFSVLIGFLLNFFGFSNVANFSLTHVWQMINDVL